MQSAFPAYYAPVQMAVVQPFGLQQQPVLAMPHGYVPMAYQTTAAPVQPPVTTAPAVQPAPAIQMPVPAPGSTAPPRAVPTAQTQMPQPYLPSSPIPADPVIPPPPIFNSEPPRSAPDSVRPRFTDFYRPADLPPPRRPSVDEPVRTAGRTPFTAPIPMPMPMPSSTPAAIPTSNNPLPRLPADVWGTSPYRHVLANLPTELPDLLDLQHRSDMFVGDPEPVPRPSSRLAGLFGSRDKGKKPLRGLFRSRSTSGPNDVGGSSSGSRHGHGHARAQTVTAILIPPAGDASTSTINMPQPNIANTGGMPVPTVGPPIRFDHTGEHAGFVNHSHHRVMYKNKMYPTALHLLEAIKFTHQPALQEKIRTCKDVNDMYPLSASLQEHVRSDWGQVFLKTVRGAFSFSYAFCFWVGIFDETGSVLRWRRCCISSLNNIRVYGRCSYVRALRTLCMRTTTRTGGMVPWARVPTNSVKRSFGSGNDYGKKAKADSEMRCSCLCKPTHACHAYDFLLSNIYYSIIPFCFLKIDILERISIYFQDDNVRFFCLLPLVSLRCVVLDADSDDSAPLASCALTALSTACRRTFSGILSQYSSSFLPRTLSIAIGLSSRGVRPITSSPCACVFGRASK